MFELSSRLIGIYKVANQTRSVAIGTCRSVSMVAWIQGTDPALSHQPFPTQQTTMICRQRQSKLRPDTASDHDSPCIFTSLFISSLVELSVLRIFMVVLKNLYNCYSSDILSLVFRCSRDYRILTGGGLK